MGVAMAVGSAALGLYGQNKALEAQGAANAQTAKNMITSMNFNLQNLEQERADAFDATIEELEKIKIQGSRLTSQVNAAVNEGLAGGGRTADLIKRASQADVDRATANAKDNYRRKSNEIDLNKESALVNTKAQIGSIRQPEAPSLLSSLATLGAAYYTGLQTEESLKAIRSKAGVGGYDGKTTAGGWQGVADPNYAFDMKALKGDIPDFKETLGFQTELSFDTKNFSFQRTNPYVSKATQYESLFGRKYTF